MSYLEFVANSWLKNMKSLRDACCCFHETYMVNLSLFGPRPANDVTHAWTQLSRILEETICELNAVIGALKELDFFDYRRPSIDRAGRILEDRLLPIGHRAETLFGACIPLIMGWGYWQEQQITKWSNADVKLFECFVRQMRDVC